MRRMTALLALSALAMVPASAPGMEPAFRRPERDRDNRSPEEHQRRIAAAQAKRARRAAKKTKEPTNDR